MIGCLIYRVFFSLFMSVFAAAASSVSPAPIYNFNLTKYSIQKISIRGLNISVDLHKNKKNSSFLVSAQSKDFRLLVKGDELEITDLRLLDGKNVDTTGSNPRSIHIESPFVPVVMTSQKIKFQSQDWDEKVFLSTVDGDLEIVKTKAQQQLKIINGSLDLKDVQANVDIMLGDGEIKASHSQLTGFVKHYKGKSRFENTQFEQLKLSLFDVRALFENSFGQLQVLQKNGSAKWTDFKGELKADILAADYDIGFLPESSILVKSEKGSTVLRGPVLRNIKLNLAAESGDLTLSPRLQLTQEIRGVSYKGLLSGEGLRSSATVRSIDGRIVFKLQD